MRIRKAVEADTARIAEIMRDSMAALGTRYYDEQQIRSAVEHIAVVDPMLIDDGTYFVVEDDSNVIACGGWSRRAKLFTGGTEPEPAGEGAGAPLSGAGGGLGGAPAPSPARLLDPRHEPARVRAMFVAPSYARRGVGRLILDTCEAAARDEQFEKMELMATLPGEPLYAACGYAVAERVEITLPDGVRLACAKMEKTLEVSDGEPVPRLHR